MSRALINKPVEVYDCQSGETVMVQAHLVFLCGDNPMLAEFASTAALNANYPCRVCRYGGTWKERRKEDAFFRAFEVSNLYTYAIIANHADMT